jgi:hypothetical protein
MTDAEHFIETFTAIWAAPEPERFPELFNPDAWLLHPGMAERLPASEVVSYITGVKAGAPDIHLIPEDWAIRGDVLYVDWTMRASIDGQTVSWVGADKCVLTGPRADSITAFFDTHPIWEALDPSMRRDTGLEIAAAQRAGVA